jgi:hypothetical protein
MSQLRNGSNMSVSSSVTSSTMGIGGFKKGGQIVKAEELCSEKVNELQTWIERELSMQASRNILHDNIQGQVLRNLLCSYIPTY